MRALHKVRRAVLPAVVFVGVALVHFIWLGMFPERDPTQARWATVAQPAALPWISNYVKTQSYWFGYSYALSLAFAVTALRRYWEQRRRAARNLAIGGATFSGFITVAGCFLLGCCGSPMLGVYLSWFGASFLPLAKPLLAGFTTLLIGASWWWMRHKLGHPDSETQTTNSCSTENCDCRPTASRPPSAHSK